MKLQGVPICFSCDKPANPNRFCCVICYCCQFCSLECATVKHTKFLCQKLYYRKFYYQVKYGLSFAMVSTPTPGVMLDMDRFTDAILRTNEGKFCCQCDRTISSVKWTENVGLGLAKTGDNGLIAYLACPYPDKCQRNTKYPCGVFYQCQNNPKTAWGYVSIDDATSKKKNNYDMQLVFLNETPKHPYKSKRCVMTKRDPQKGKDGIYRITFVIIAKKGETRYAYSEKDNKWGKQYYKREWEFIFVDSK